jgi:colanic acid/amylovoran biosynthesis glycosyltransferase
VRIAFLVDRFPALSETFILGQITGLIDRGHHVEIFARSCREDHAHPDVDRYRLRKLTHYWPAVPGHASVRWLKGSALLALVMAKNPRAGKVAMDVRSYGRDALTMNLAYAAKSHLTKRRYDVVHAHFGENGILGMALGEMGLLSGPLVTSFYGYDLTSYLRHQGPASYSRLFTRGQLFLPLSEDFRRRLARVGCPQDRTTIHRLGIDTTRFGFAARRTASDGVLRLVTVARLVEKKGVEYAIRAVATLIRSGRQVHHTVLGTGPLHESLARLVQDLNLQEHVQLAGAMLQPDVIRILSNAHLLVAPSVVASNGDEEGTPTAIIEGMALGLPVVATNHSGIPELVEDNISGRLVPERDVNALAEAIAHLADHSDRWPGMGEAGRRRVLALHDIDKLNDSLVELYRRLAA